MRGTLGVEYLQLGYADVENAHWRAMPVDRWRLWFRASARRHVGHVTYCRRHVGHATYCRRHVGHATYCWRHVGHATYCRRHVGHVTYNSRDAR